MTRWDELSDEEKVQAVNDLARKVVDVLNRQESICILNVLGNLAADCIVETAATPLDAAAMFCDKLMSGVRRRLTTSTTAH